MPKWSWHSKGYRIQSTRKDIFDVIKNEHTITNKWVCSFFLLNTVQIFLLTDTQMLKNTVKMTTIFMTKPNTNLYDTCLCDVAQYVKNYKRHSVKFFQNCAISSFSLILSSRGL